MRIADINIGVDNPPIVIAELSGNHNQSLDRALALVKAAHDAGVHMIKLQTYTADTITLNCDGDDFVVSDPKSLWYGRTFHSLYSEAHTPWAWQEEIIRFAESLGVACFSSVFDATSVDFLEKLDVPAYKIASQEIVHLPLIRYVAETGKPMIISTGMATLGEIDEAVNTAIKAGASDLALLKCSSSYPASPEHSNIATIPFLKKLFGCEVGLSDHTLGIGVPLAAIACGASIVEKHLTLDRGDGGVDSGFSSEPQEIEQLVSESKRVWQSLGHVQFGPTAGDIGSMSGRRSIYLCENVSRGDVASASNIKVVRPNKGLPPKYYDFILGRKFNSDFSKGDPLNWDMLI